MGLDGVEMIMEVEDEFGITIPDSDASEMRTVGDLVFCFWRRAPQVDDWVSHANAKGVSYVCRYNQANGGPANRDDSTS